MSRIRSQRRGFTKYCLMQALLAALCFWLLGLEVQAGPLVLHCDPCIDRSKLEIHAIVHGTLNDPFWQETDKAMRQAAKDMGIDFEMNLYETFSSEIMADDIRRVIRYEIDDSSHGHKHNVTQVGGLIVTIPDDTVKAAVEDAIAAGVHVFGLNLGYQYAREMGLLGYVAQNEFAAGQLAAKEFERRRLNAYGPAQKALFVNHNENDPALKERFEGFNDTLARLNVRVSQIFVDPTEEHFMAVALHDIIATCEYAYVLLGGSETVEPVTAFAQAKCGTNGTTAAMDENNQPIDTAISAPMMLAAFDGTEVVFQAIVEENMEFALTQENYLQGALPVIFSTLYASTGQRLALPFDRPVYSSGPHVVDIKDIPSDTYLACQAEAFPICDGTGEAVRIGECPCIDRNRLRIAGVVHGVLGDAFWETVIVAAVQAGFAMQVDLDVELFAPQESDEVLHNKMASKIRSVCGSGIDGIFVSMPSDTVEEAVRFCKQLRVPVININSGWKYARELEIQHIGQIEIVAGILSGERMVRAGVQEGYCLTPEPGNVALGERCDGFRSALLAANKTFGGVIQVPRDSQAQYTQIVETTVVDPEGNWDGIGLLVNGDIEPALSLQRNHQSVALGTFDVRENLFAPLDDGRLLFTIDQQQFMQGAMAVHLLAYEAFTDQVLINDAIETGPNLMEYSPHKDQATCAELNYMVCHQIPEEDYNFISTYWLAWGYSSFGAVCLLGVVCLSWMHIYRDKNIVKASQPLFLGLLVCGAVTSMSSIIPQGAQTTYRYLEDPATGEITNEPNPDVALMDVACMLTPWLYGVGFSIMFAALCAKIHRVKMIYEAGAAMRRTKVEVKDVISTMGIMLALETTILVCWTAVSPSQWERTPTVTVDGYVLESVGQCSSKYHRSFLLAQLLLHAGCLLYAVFLCWQTSEIPTEFAEGSYISLSVLCIFQVAVLSIPIGYMVEDTPDIYFFVKGASLFLQNFTVLCLIFIPKGWRVVTGNDMLPLPRVGLTQHGTGRASSAPTYFTNNQSQPSNPNLANGANGQYAAKPPSTSRNISIDESLRQNGNISGPNFSTNQHDAGPYNLSSKNGTLRQESAPVARMARLDSDDDSEKKFVAKAIGVATLAGARYHLKAGLDGDSYSSASSLGDVPKLSMPSIGSDNELADLAAEISRAEQSRGKVYSSASAPPSDPDPIYSQEAVDGLPKRPSTSHDSPDVDNSAESSSAGSFTAPKRSLVLSKMPGRQQKIFPNVSTSVGADSSEEIKEETSKIERYGDSDGPEIHKNPQEGSQVSSLEASTSTLAASTTGITRAEASKAEIFRKAIPSDHPALPSTPLRLKKEPQAYGENATLALGITKANGNFLRKVAASFGSASLGSSTQQLASFGSKTSLLHATPSRPKPTSHAPKVDKMPTHTILVEDKSREFQVERQDRPVYVSLKKSATNEEAEAKKASAAAAVGEIVFL